MYGGVVTGGGCLKQGAPKAREGKRPFNLFPMYDAEFENEAPGNGDLRES